MEVLRYSAFTTDPDGGNPAGVVLDAAGAGDAEMLRIAAGLGYSETAFLTPREDGEFDVRYFSPLAEVPFCGHATIATGVAWAERHGTGVMRLHARPGLVEVTTTSDDDAPRATLLSVEPHSVPLGDEDRIELLAALRWDEHDLDPDLPLRVAYAGAWHPIVAAASRDRLAALSYDFDALGALMELRDWTTVDLVWRENATTFWARNPFPPGGVVEDPATGAAAAAFGGYLRELGVTGEITVHQGDDYGRPSLITVGIPEAGGISVTGAAVPIA